MDSENATPAAKPAAPAAEKLPTFKVARPFHSPTRRFKKDAAIAPSDLAGTPLDFEHLKKRGFVVAA